MLRAIPVRLASVTPMQLVVGMLVCLFLVSVDGVMPQSADADGSNRSLMAATRQLQLRAEAAMSRADKEIRQLKRERKHRRKRGSSASQRLGRIKERRQQAQARLRVTSRRLDRARLERNRVLRVHPAPSGAQVTDQPRLRERVDKQRDKTERLGKQIGRLRHKARQTRKEARRTSGSTKAYKRRIAREKRRRERAESVLGGRIERMVDLAKAQADIHVTSRPGRGGFHRPARGTISQGYGCQGGNKKHGCGYFHDGIDIAADRGAPVRASASGYVAYVGWNPWDEGRRAYIVIIGHPGGYESIYGHLTPVARVRAGQRVRRGQLIGLMGSTGRSTGPHVHWEIHRGSKTVNPRSVGR